MAQDRYRGNASSMLIAYLLWFFLGWLGAHRLYLSRFLSGLFMLALWGIGTAFAWILIGYFLLIPWAIWWFIDIFLIPGMVRSENEAVLERLNR